jgi:hypothetical protein
VRLGKNREFVRDWKGSSCGIFQITAAMHTGKLRELDAGQVLTRGSEVCGLYPGALWINLA